MADDSQNTGQAQSQAQAQDGALQVKVPDDLQKGVYSNAVSVSVNSNEVVVDFGYLVPNTQTPLIEVVSRVNMNQNTAASFLQVLSGAMQDFEAKRAAAAEAQAAAVSAPAPVVPTAPVAPVYPDAPLSAPSDNLGMPNSMNATMMPSGVVPPNPPMPEYS